MLRGVGTALITPFMREGGKIDCGAIRVDYEALLRLIEEQIAGGVSFLVPCGTTGESPTLSHAEHIDVVRFTVETVNGRVPVIAGTGSNSTAEAVDLTRAAKMVGADGALVVSPYYNKPTPAGMLDYFGRISDVGLPVILYDIPGRTGRGVPTEVILRLAEQHVIAGIKWASGDFAQLMEIIANRPNDCDFSILAGDDNLAFPLLALGGDGVISVVSNIIPDKFSLMVGLALNGKWDAARIVHFGLLPLMKAMFLETNPLPVKTAWALMNGTLEVFQSPLVRMEFKNYARLLKVLKDFNLLPADFVPHPPEY